VTSERLVFNFSSSGPAYLVDVVLDCSVAPLDVHLAGQS